MDGLLTQLSCHPQIADLELRLAHALAQSTGKESVEVEDVQPADPLLLVPPGQSDLDMMPVADVEARIRRIHDAALEGSDAHSVIYDKVRHAARLLIYL